MLPLGLHHYQSVTVTSVPRRFTALGAAQAGAGRGAVERPQAAEVGAVGASCLEIPGSQEERKTLSVLDSRLHGQSRTLI